MRDNKSNPMEPTGSGSMDDTIPGVETDPILKSGVYISAENGIGTIEILVGQSDISDVSMNVSFADRESNEEVAAKELIGFYSIANKMASAAIGAAMLKQHPDAAKKIADSRPTKQYDTVAKMDPDTRKIVVSEQIRSK